MRGFEKSQFNARRNIRNITAVEQENAPNKYKIEKKKNVKTSYFRVYLKGPTLAIPVENDVIDRIKKKDVIKIRNIHAHIGIMIIP